MVANPSKFFSPINICVAIVQQQRMHTNDPFLFIGLWVKFFQSAGVPPATAASYAHIFYENRMELDMLTDLNKEYLREMGIMPMGDIIAILRHAKKVHDQNTRDKILSGDKPAVATVSVSPIVPSAVTSKKILRK